MDKKILNSVFSLNDELDINKLRQEVLSDPYIKKEIERLELNEQQIKKGMGILQRYHDFILENNHKPYYELYVNMYGFLDEDHSKNPIFEKSRQLENFWLTSITPLDPIIESYFLENKTNRVFSPFKATLQTFLDNLINTKESQRINTLFKNIASKGIFEDNIWLFDAKNKYASNILKYISSVSALGFNKSVALLNSNDLYSYISSNPEEKKSIIWHLNRVDVLIINNLTLGIKPQWYLDTLINIFETRAAKKLPILISSSRDIVSSKTKLLSSYYYSKFDQSNDLEDLFKQTISEKFEKIVIN
ncbi:Hypothetical protein, putative primosome component [Metamycoplasma auris 15026]|uniref:Uncharacterized protein n=1 Tax=Metamycoplasma auris 15026 TaxID=1188233 RepID=N9TTF1_9BACT|nr:hypothetical protein [Metamycoplasma auris]ENY69345.1 Hypothetical protein, putative primosome component [Metamycoplasma auris 15026]